MIEDTPLAQKPIMSIYNCRDQGIKVLNSHGITLLMIRMRLNNIKMIYC